MHKNITFDALTLKNTTMKKNLLAIGALTTLFFACNGGGDKFVGRWIGSMDGKADTFNVAKEGDNYNLTHMGSKMTGTAAGDTLTLSMGTNKIKFGYNKSNSQLSISIMGKTYSYDKK